jgi:hypothetical protein
VKAAAEEEVVVGWCHCHWSVTSRLSTRMKMTLCNTKRTTLRHT